MLLREYRRRLSESAEPAKKYPYTYHMTNLDNAHSIAADKKLRTHRPWHGSDQDIWPDGSQAKRSYFIDQPERAKKFSPGGKAVLLRVQKHPKLGFKRERGTGDTVTHQPIHSRHLQYQDHKGRWRRLSRLLHPENHPEYRAPKHDH
jgi:hypothetical protein